jgi:Flp pilus assembly protein TadG
MQNNRGQVLPIMALLVVAFIGLLGLALDLGRLYIARAELSRAVDAAALAGVVDLPDQAAAEGRAAEYLTANMPTASAEFLAPEQEFELRVKGTKSVDMLFMSIFGFGNVDISVTAAAGGTVPAGQQIVFVLDDTGTMANGCNSSQTNTNCPIRQSRDAAHAFVDSLAGGNTEIGIIPFRGCYGDQRFDPFGGTGNTGCVLFSDVQSLTTDAGALHSAIDGFTAAGGSGTNLCVGLDQALEMFLTSGDADAQKVVVVLTDGDDRYAQGAENSSRGNPPPNVYPPPAQGGTHECVINDYPQNGSSYGSDYDDRVDALDNAAYDKAETLKSMGVEIYVAGFGVVAQPANGNTCQLGPVTSVGSGSGRESTSDSLDRNLNRCLASSTPGTNDHYLEAITPQEIPTIFEQILQSIGFRLVE